MHPRAQTPLVAEMGSYVFHLRSMEGDRQSRMAYPVEKERELVACVAAADKVLRYLYAHFREPVALEDVARSAGISSGYLSRIFNSELCGSFSDYLNSLRVQEAKRLLIGSGPEYLLPKSTAKPRNPCTLRPEVLSYE